MASIRIPSVALPGFEALSKINEDQAVAFADFLENMPVGTRMQEIEGFLASDLNLNQSKEIVATLRSFSELLEPSKVDVAFLSANLASSYKEQTKTNFTQEDEDNLRNNLSFIFTHSTNLRLTLKAYDLVGGDTFLFQDSKIIVDLRLVFNDEIQDNHKRNALLVHHLHIEYYKEGLKKIVLALDLADLRNLKKDIDRAITKEDVIKNDYKEVFNFLNLSTDGQL